MSTLVPVLELYVIVSDTLLMFYSSRHFVTGIFTPVDMSCILYSHSRENIIHTVLFYDIS